MLISDDIKITLMKDWLGIKDMFNFNISLKNKRNLNPNDEIWKMNYFLLDHQLIITKRTINIISKIKSTNIFLKEWNNEIKDYFHNNGKLIKKIKVTCWEAFDIKEFFLILCPNLTNLNFGYTNNYNEFFLKCLFNYCPQLTHISEFPKFIMSVDQLHIKCPHLQHLDLTSTPYVTKLNLSEFHSLTYLNMSGCFLISDIQISEGTCLPLLKTLILSECDSIENNTFSKVFKVCPLLIHLEIFKSEKITDNSIKEIGENMKFLEYLDISGCHLLTNASIKSISENCYNLKFLDISFCQRITNLNSINKLLNLNTLKIKYCINIRPIYNKKESLKIVGYFTTRKNKKN